MWSAVSRARGVGASLPAVRGVRRVCVEAVVGGRTLALETGRIGPLADGVVFARYGDTSLLVSAVGSWELATADFLPLQVDYREKAFAGGVIPGTLSRREANASDRETLSARVIDRSLRPLFPKGYFYDTQLICSVMSFDKDCDPGMLSIIAASAALHVSNIPWNGPAAAVRVGWLDGKPILAPTHEQDAASKLNLLYSGNEERTLMLEIGAAELPERDIVHALRFAHDQLQPLLQVQEEFRALAGKEKKDLAMAIAPDDVVQAVHDLIWEDARHMYRQHHFKKAERGNAQRLLFIKIKESLRDKFPPEKHRYFSQAGDMVMKAALRSLVHEAADVSPPMHCNPLLGPALPASATPHLSQGDAALVERGAHTADMVDAAVTATASEVAAVTESDAVDAVSVEPASARDVPALAAASSSGSESDSSSGAEVQSRASELKPEDVQPLYHLQNAEGCRPDGRPTTKIRQLRSEVNVLPLVHGSSLFSRGDTQVLCTSTLGPLDLAQMLRPLSGPATKKHFFLHYDFPPYCTNETGKVGGSNRRMVGHGALAEKALVAVMPDETEFPYTVRVTSEVAGSDGSSSMATVCGATLALMDAGVPLKAPVAGISIGSMCPPVESWGPGSKYVLLTDIFGLEDHSGDMDFKIAGSRYGITAAQLDVKPAGLPLEVLEQALWRARDARLQVLDTMAECIARPRSELKDAVPRIEQMMIPPELIGKLIGPGGSNVRRIQTATGARVQIDPDSPLVSVYAPAGVIETAKGMIHSALDEHRRMTGSPLSVVTSPTLPTLTVGTAVKLVVLKVHEFGVVLGNAEGMELGWMHISEFTPKRVTRVTDVLNEGDSLTAMVVDVDVRGRGKFSMRALLQHGDDVMTLVERCPATIAAVEAAAAAAAATQAAAATAAPAATSTASSAANTTGDAAAVTQRKEPGAVTELASSAPTPTHVPAPADAGRSEVESASPRPLSVADWMRSSSWQSEAAPLAGAGAGAAEEDDLFVPDMFRYLLPALEQVTPSFAALRSRVRPASASSAAAAAVTSAGAGSASGMQRAHHRFVGRTAGGSGSGSGGASHRHAAGGARYVPQQHQQHRQAQYGQHGQQHQRQQQQGQQQHRASGGRPYQQYYNSNSNNSSGGQHGQQRRQGGGGGGSSGYAHRSSGGGHAHHPHREHAPKPTTGVGASGAGAAAAAAAPVAE